MSAKINNFEKFIQEYINSSLGKIVKAKELKNLTTVNALSELNRLNESSLCHQLELQVGSSLCAIKNYDFYKNRQECICWFEDFLVTAIENRKFLIELKEDKKLKEDSINERAFELIKGLQENCTNWSKAKYWSKARDSFRVQQSCTSCLDWRSICAQLDKKYNFCKDIDMIKKKKINSIVLNLLNKCKKLKENKTNIDENSKNELLKWAKEIFSKLKLVRSNCGETIEELLAEIDDFLKNNKNKKKFQLIEVANPDETDNTMGNILSALS